MADAALDLDALILDAERAVIERDQRVRDGTARLRASLRARASRGLAVGIGAVLGGLLLGALLWRRGRTASTVSLRGARTPLSRGRRAFARMPWLRLLPLAWPLLPSRLRSRMPPGAAALLTAFGAPALARAVRDGSEPPDADTTLPPPAAVLDLDWQRYLGQWYEVARLPSTAEAECSSDATAVYSVEGDAIRVDKRCRHDDGRIEAVHGRAVPSDASQPARLKVSFAPAWLRWLPLVWVDHWVLYIDPNYRMALVGTPDRRHLWLLSRTPSLSIEDLQRLCNEARERGYDPARLLRTPQSAPTAPSELLH